MTLEDARKEAQKIANQLRTFVNVVHHKPSEDSFADGDEDSRYDYFPVYFTPSRYCDSDIVELIKPQ